MSSIDSRSQPTLAFSCGARSASKLTEQGYLRSTLSRRQLQGFVGPPFRREHSTWDSALLRCVIFQQLDPRLCLVTTPLRFTRDSIPVAVHFCPGTILDVEGSFFTRRHLGTACLAFTTKLRLAWHGLLGPLRRLLSGSPTSANRSYEPSTDKEKTAVH